MYLPTIEKGGSENVMELSGWTAKLEDLEVSLSKEFYKQYAGLPYDENVMVEHSARFQGLCREGLKQIGRDEIPELLFIHAVHGTEEVSQTRLKNQIYKKRNDDVAVTFNGQKVDLNSVRRFNREHIDDPQARKSVFDGLMGEARRLTSALWRRFQVTREAYEKHALEPLGVYLVEEGISLKKLKEVVDQSARRAKPRFESESEELSPEVIGKEMEYFDDLYVYRHRIFEPFDSLFKDVDYVHEMRRITGRLGFDMDKVDIDSEPREGKYSSPVCFGIQIPRDVRVLYQKTSPFGDYTSFAHELGHGLHFISVDEDRDFHERYLIPHGVAEIFSTLFEHLATSEEILTEELSIDEDTLEEILRRRRFMALYFLTFYGANSMLKIRFWEERLTMSEADQLYEELTQKYMGIRYPGTYWQTHHVVSMNDLYAPSYLLAEIRKSELLGSLRGRFGDDWWKKKQAGSFLREEFLSPGASIDLGSFSCLDPEPYLGGILP